MPNLADGQRLIVIDAADLNNLELADLGVRQGGDAPESLQRRSPASAANSRRPGPKSTLNLNLIFDRQARRPRSLALLSSARKTTVALPHEVDSGAGLPVG